MPKKQDNVRKAQVGVAHGQRVDVRVSVVVTKVRSRQTSTAPGTSTDVHTTKTDPAADKRQTKVKQCRGTSGERRGDVQRRARVRRRRELRVRAADGRGAGDGRAKRVDARATAPVTARPAATGPQTAVTARRDAGTVETAVTSCSTNSVVRVGVPLEPARRLWTLLRRWDGVADTEGEHNRRVVSRGGAQRRRTVSQLRAAKAARQRETKVDDCHKDATVSAVGCRRGRPSVQSFNNQPSRRPFASHQVRVQKNPNNHNISVKHIQEPSILIYQLFKIDQ